MKALVISLCALPVYLQYTVSMLYRSVHTAFKERRMPKILGRHTFDLDSGIAGSWWIGRSA